MGSFQNEPQASNSSAVLTMAMEKAWSAFKKLTMFAPKRNKFWVPAGAKQPGTPAGSGGAYRYPAPG